MKQKQLLRTLLAAVCLLVGTNAWGKTYTGSVSFAAQNRITNNGNGTFTTANNAGNQYALALADLSSLDNIAIATSVTLEFDVTIPSGGRLLIGIGDKSTRGTNANGSNKATYETDGLVMRYGTSDGSSVRVNGGSSNTNLFGTSSHVTFTLNRTTGKYGYTIKYVDGESVTKTGFSSSDISTEVSNATIVEAYTWLSSTTFTISDVSYSYELQPYDYSVTAKDSEGNTLKENLVSGTSSDGDVVTVDCPYAFQEGGVWYVKQDESFTVSFNYFDNTKDVTYAADPSIVYYAEGETLGSNTASAGLSNGAYGHVVGGSGSGNKGKSIGTFGAGVYQATAYFVSADVGKNRGFYVRNSNLANANGANVVASASTKAAGSYSTSQFMLSASTPLTVSGYTSDEKVNQSAEFDYIILRKVRDLTDVELAIIDCKKYETSSDFATYIDGKNSNNELSTAADVYAAHTAWQIEQADASSSNDYTKVIRNAAVADATDWDGAVILNGQQYTNAPDEYYIDRNGANIWATQMIYGLPAGKYQVKVATRAKADTYSHIYVSYNGEYDICTARGTHASSTGNELGNGWAWTYVPFEITETANILLGFYAATAGGWASCDDWHLYKVTEDQSFEITSTSGWATLYTPYALDFSTLSESLTAYTATFDGSTVELKKVTDVPARTGVVLKGSKGIYNIPLAESSSTSQGGLKGSPTWATSYDSNYKFYYLALNAQNQAQFKLLGEGGSIAAGKAYLQIDNNNSGSAKALSVVFANDPTGIANVNAAEGAQPAKRIVNGQFVIEKNGKRYNAAGAEF